MIQPKTKYEEEILKEMSKMPERLQKKLSRIVLFLKKEILEEELSELKATEDFLSVCGKWKDHRSVNDQIEDIVTHRKSSDRTENIF